MLVWIKLNDQSIFFKYILKRTKITKSKLFFIKVSINQKIFIFGKKLFLTILIRKP